MYSDVSFCECMGAKVRYMDPAMTKRHLSLGFAIGIFAAGCATPVDNVYGGPAGAPAEEAPPPPVGGTNTNEATHVGSGTGGSSGSGGSTGSGGAAGEAGAAGAAGSGGTEPIITEPDLAASYSFDQALSVEDESGHGHHGTTEGTGVVLGIAGKVSGAVSFSGMDGRITIPASNGLDFVQAATIEFWIRLNSVSAGSIVSRGTGTGDNSVVVKTVQGNLQVTFSRAGIGSATLVSSPNLLGSDWTHVAIVNDGTSLRLYINGELEQSESGGQLGSIGTDLRIGKSAASDMAMSGVLDELNWWTTARTDGEICGDAGGAWSVIDGAGTCALP